MDTSYINENSECVAGTKAYANCIAPSNVDIGP